MSFDFTEQDHVAKDVFTYMLELWREEDRETDSVEEFVSFAKDYLATNRPVQSFQPEANIGVVLTNNIRLVPGRYGRCSRWRSRFYTYAGR